MLLLLLAFLLLSTLLIILLYWWSRYRLKNELKKQFFSAGRTMGLLEEELAELWRCAGALKKPVDVIQNKTAFELCMRKLVRENPSIAESIAHIRKRLRFDSLPWFLPLTGTKDIDLYQTGFLAFGNLAYSSVVWEKSELELHLALFDIPAERIDAGSEVKFSFLREEDGRYYFQGKVLRTYQEDSRLVIVLSHTDQLFKIQLRSSVRWKVRMLARVYLHTDQSSIYLNMPEKALEGIIEDISLGGLKICFKTFVKISLEDKIYVEFVLRSRHIKVLCSVKNVRGDINRICVGVKFDNLNQEDENYIKEFINQEQREFLKAYRTGEAKSDFSSS